MQKKGEIVLGKNFFQKCFGEKYFSEKFFLEKFLEKNIFRENVFSLFYRGESQLLINFVYQY